jgi:hypothetical protein
MRAAFVKQGIPESATSRMRLNCEFDLDTPGG